MPTYIYRATFQGQKVLGKIEAKSKAEAEKKLSKEGYISVSFVEKREAKKEGILQSLKAFLFGKKGH